MLCQNCVKAAIYLKNFKIIESSIIPKFARLCSTINNESLTEWNNVKSKYSDKQLTLVLKTLNKCNLKEMKKFAIAENHIKIFESFKKAKKTSKSLDDLIVLNTLNVSELDSICSAICCSPKNTKTKASIVTPPIKVKDLENINTVVGLRIGSSYVSWSQLESTGSHCNILKWDCQSVSDLPLNASHAEIIKMGVNIAREIPIADAYVMEKDGSRPLSKINTSIYRVLLRHQQLISIVLTALSTKYQAEHSPESPNSNFFEKFYMMKAFAPAQLFNLFFGSEIVSSNDVVQSLFQQEDVGLQNVLSLSSEGEVAQFYESLDLCRKEEINKSLLLTLTFFESAVLESRNRPYNANNKS
ncbi:hypothetical protein TSAR_005759 [Trichomalopsis sarcophagae]|uniref:Transcription elongation factor, mitochondrial n=1 Tax=Trichomalopsis sarcophagae TaxID=543379 RepID=A0A232FKF6_9HYME|nr:hypothetical protein TSAR_005759 [Trichomalopsis sarcophagae]